MVDAESNSRRRSLAVVDGLIGTYELRMMTSSSVYSLMYSLRAVTVTPSVKRGLPVSKPSPYPR